LLIVWIGIFSKSFFMKKYFLFFLVLSVILAEPSTSHAQKKYFTDIADSLRIDSIINAELNFPSNIIVNGSDTALCTIYKTPSKSSEIMGYIGILEYPAPIIISKGNKETINGKTDYWYRICFEKYHVTKIGWVFGDNVVLLKPDIVINPSAYNGKYIQYVGDPCIYGLSIKANDPLNIKAKTYGVFFDNPEDLSSCSSSTIAMINVKINGNIFASDSSELKKGWFMKPVSKANSKYKGYLLFQSESGLYPYLKTNSSTEIIDFEMLHIKGDNVNFRKGPSTDFAVIKKLSNDTPCLVLEIGSEQTINGVKDRWYKVNAFGQVGWVFGEFISLKK
jgi:hypothetical protein